MNDRGNRKGRILAGTLLAFVLTAAAGGCVFDPRDPEAPSTGESIPYLPRNSAENVWTNLQIALNYGDVFGWEENIHPDFEYFADSDANVDALVDWNYEKERAFISGFLDSGVKITADMIDDDFEVPGDGVGETTWTGVVYMLDVTTLSDNSKTRYRASAEIHFRLDKNFWYIDYWRDLQGENDPDTGNQLSSMGVLRATFGSK